ncbi:hypothetical protein BDV93DRAFT_557412 [Ceratobasidium sp. AG-I]|nr:hypothetical protein BDV93DRAFT_557412 [Ceratobasidium sp. AG-I]
MAVAPSKCNTCIARGPKTRCNRALPICDWCARHPDDGPCTYPAPPPDAGAPPPGQEGGPGGHRQDNAEDEPGAPPGGGDGHAVDERVLEALRQEDQAAREQLQAREGGPVIDRATGEAARGAQTEGEGTPKVAHRTAGGADRAVAPAPHAARRGTATTPEIATGTATTTMTATATASTTVTVTEVTTGAETGTETGVHTQATTVAPRVGDTTIITGSVVGAAHLAGAHIHPPQAPQTAPTITETMGKGVGIAVDMGTGNRHMRPAYPPHTFVPPIASLLFSLFIHTCSPSQHPASGPTPAFGPTPRLRANTPPSGQHLPSCQHLPSGQHLHLCQHPPSGQHLPSGQHHAFESTPS